MSGDDRDIVELRRYALRPGRREALIDLFERELLEPQEAAGLRVLGQFRDPDHPDTFVWLRGFEPSRSRAAALAAFYGGPVWARHRDAANATMVDSDDVLLLRPAAAGSGVRADRSARPRSGEGAARGRGLLQLTVWPLAPDAAPGFPRHFDEELRPAFERAGARILATYRSEHGPNEFPALPVREGEEVFVWLARFDDEAAHGAYLRALREEAPERALEGRLDGTPLVLRLVPTTRSALA